MALRYRIRIGAPLPEGVAGEIERRFGPVGTFTIRNRRPALRGVVADQSALRALLALLWDLNTDLISLRIRPEAHQP
jgi:hypothetical protein